jgi:hypothetical protein
MNERLGMQVTRRLKLRLAFNPDEQKEKEHI